MTFNGEKIVYTQANANEMDKKLPDLDALSLKSIVTANGISGLDGIDVTLVHGKRNTYIHTDDFLEAGQDKKDVTDRNVTILCKGNTQEQIDLSYTRMVGEDTWKTNKGDTIEHFVGELAEVHKEDRHLEEPESIFEVEHKVFCLGLLRFDMWMLVYNLLATSATSWIQFNADFRVLDASFKAGVSEHIGQHFAEKGGEVENKLAEDKNVVAKAAVKPASVEAGAAEGHEIALTQNIATVGVNSNL